MDTIKKADNQLLVIFGASGDLSRRKLIPSLFELHVRNLLPDKFFILGASRTPFTNESYRAEQKKHLLASKNNKEYTEQQVDRFLQLVFYLSFDPSSSADYYKLKNCIHELEERLGFPDKIIYYLATPPAMYEIIPTCLKENELNQPNAPSGWRRVVVEKPFGTSLELARHLGKHLRSIFREHEIYRIDHYLGKETVQNILVLRFANGIFEPLWNRNYIDSVEITATETLGVENRGKYYESAGAMRDMIQNHLMQLMAFVAMEAPATFDPEAIRDEIAKVFRAIRPYSESELTANVVRAQYTARQVKDTWIPGYKEEKDVLPTSDTETYVAMKFFIDNWRWGGVPFYFYTGKRLPAKKSEITIHFKATPTQLFVGQCSGSLGNKLTLRIQPDESISLRFGLKMPGAGFVVKQVSMDFRYDSLLTTYLPDAYERLLLDAMLGDSTLYARSDALEASWKFIDPVLNRWAVEGSRTMYTYPALTNGPNQRRRLWDNHEHPVCNIPQH